MTRNLNALALALVASLALSAAIASMASAEPALYTAGVGPGETVHTDGTQVGNDKLSIGIGGPELTCASITEHSEGVTAGPETTESIVTPIYEECHAVVTILGAKVTRTLTITMNGCVYRTNATKNTAGFAFGIDISVECPKGKKIEIHVYNNGNKSDSGASTICTYDLEPQTINNQIQATNESGEGLMDVRGHMTATLSIVNTLPSSTCSTATSCVYQGTHTLRATNESEETIDTTIS